MAFHYQSIINLFSLINLTDRMGGSVCCKEQTYSNLMNEYSWGHRSEFLLIERWWRLSTISTRLIHILFCCHESSVTTSWQLRRRALYQSSKSIQTILSADKQYLTWSAAFMTYFWVLIYMDWELLLFHQHETSQKNQSFNQGFKLWTCTQLKNSKTY